MEMVIDFPGGARVDAHFSQHTVETDQPYSGGGEDSAPAPYSIFLASIGTCAGIYILGFCRNRGIPYENIRIVQRMHFNRETGLAEIIDLEIRVPADFPEKYYEALVRSAERCKVKAQMEHPPRFNTYTQVMEAD